ncbi:Putative pyridoxal phosphate-dependent aminotransferase (plasmid) [Azospirillum lipoferum 4B]|uniref:Pyridoxal phosphate-dependent aminotransferase n=1 Tax=Azospirillum lipoferum (strain 4B) TaxID=862719 RepID=G7ZIZ8_AZOL4|nr:Putative pyridoxal phosphate-dependent aminotransferase [Azospirillum lipoferum 4B]
MTTEPLIPLAVPDLSGREEEYLRACIASTFVSTVGPFVPRFEEQVAAAIGSRGAVATCSGTAGLHVALTALGVGQNDLVVLPSLTFIASANAIAQCGAQPWLFDVTQESWTLDPELLERRLAADTERRPEGLFHRPSGRRIAAVMPVHTLGLPADMHAIVPVARRYGLPVVADSAAALGATCRGKPPGALGADLSVLSFNGNKTVTAGAGGAVVGDDPELLALVRHLSSTARVGQDYDHDRPGFNYRMTNLQAAVGCAQMERWESLVAAKRRIRHRYDQAFAGLEGVEPFPAPPWVEGACWFSGIVLRSPTWEGREAVLRSRLRELGIDSRPFWKPVHLQAPYRNAPCTEMPVCEELWLRVLTLPCSAGLTDAEQDRVIAALLQAFQST